MSATKTRVPLPEVTLSEFDGVRHLHLDSIWVQGSMRVGAPFDIELEYVQRMMVWLLLLPAEGLARRHAVQLGLGAAAITKFCHKRLRMRTTAVELNPQVIAVCRQWFHLPPDDARLSVLNQDAGAYVADPAHAETADVLCVDLYDHEAAGPVLDSEDFYADCHRVLADGGVMTVNLFGRDASFARSAGRIASVFGPSAVLSMRPTREGNTVLIAARGLTFPDRPTLAARAENIETRFGLPARKWLRMIRPLPAALGDDDLA